MSPKGLTKPSSLDAVQALILAHDISRGILQPIIASINALLMVMVMRSPLFVSNSLRRHANRVNYCNDRYALLETRQDIPGMVLSLLLSWIDNSLFRTVTASNWRSTLN